MGADADGDEMLDGSGKLDAFVQDPVDCATTPNVDRASWSVPLLAATANHTTPSGSVVSAIVKDLFPVPGDATEPDDTISAPGEPAPSSAYRPTSMLPDDVAMLTHSRLTTTERAIWMRHNAAVLAPTAALESRIS